MHAQVCRKNKKCIQRASLSFFLPCVCLSVCLSVDLLACLRSQTLHLNAPNTTTTASRVATVAARHGHKALPWLSPRRRQTDTQHTEKKKERENRTNEPTKLKESRSSELMLCCYCSAPNWRRRTLAIAQASLVARSSSSLPRCRIALSTAKQRLLKSARVV